MELATPLLGAFKNVARPAWHGLNRVIYLGRFQSRLRKIAARYGKRVKPHYDGVAPAASADSIWNRLRAVAPASTRFYVAALDEDPQHLGGERYYSRHAALYRDIGHPREKAVEHGLTFELADLARVKRHCDVAASRSPLEHVFGAEHPAVEYWKQDLVFDTDLSRRIIGGYAQEMRQVPDGFFDSMTLHCSFEHFEEHSDSDFVIGVDRVLGPSGACFILPLYMDLEPKIFFDPTVVSLQRVSTFDREAKLCPTFDYRQEHGRYYSPETLTQRVLSKLPAALRASVIHFGYADQPGRGLYLRFALVLHRVDSIFRSEHLKAV